MSVNLFHNILGDTHQGRLIDKLGNFATENFGEKGLQFFNTLTVAQVSLLIGPFGVLMVNASDNDVDYDNCHGHDKCT